MMNIMTVTMMMIMTPRVMTTNPILTQNFNKMEGNLRIISFNCAGFKYRNFNYIKDTFKKCDILMLQETWLYNFEFNSFINVLPRCQYYAISSMDETEVGRIGRPFGGSAILWHSDLALTFIPIKTISNRICSVQIKSSNFNLVIINLYMPCDENNDVNVLMYGDVLSEVSSIISLYEDDNEIIIGGDLNVDFSRTNSLNLSLLKTFISDENLTCATLPIVNDNYTRISSTGDKSFIDHFLVTKSSDIKNVFISIDGDNLSDHMPVTIETMYNTEKIEEHNECRYVNNWNGATDSHIQNYKSLLNQELTDFIIPEYLLNCNDLLCNEHSNDIQELMDELIQIMINCANKTIPTKKMSNHSKGIPGWKDFVQPYKDRSIYWTNLWKSAGFPPNGPFADERRFARYKYHWAIKKVKKDKDKIIKQKTADQLARKSFNSFWSTIKQSNGTNKPKSKVIDGLHTDKEISSHFRSIYSNLYNSVPDDEFKSLKNCVNNLVSSKCCHNKCTQDNCQSITNDIVQKAIGCLAENKDDETYGITSDHFIHANDLVINNLSLIISLMLKHGSSSHLMNKSTIKPIPKNKQKSLCESSNYRAISKNTIVSIIIDYVLINLIGDKLSTSSYQFAYKENFSTSLCSFLVAETIQYYRSRGSNVFMLSLDATKAFDKVQYTKLFNLLIERKICPLIIRLLLAIYSVSSAIVKWNNVKSESFEIDNGVKQGAVISAPLFALYVNPLLNKLQNLKQGCYMGNICANAFAYADDVVILAPTCTALNNIIAICENYAKEFKVCFNPDKCTLLIFTNNELHDFYFNNVNIFICGTKVKNVKSEKHLGHIFSSTNTLIDIQDVIRDIKVRTNVIINQFSCLSWQARVKIFLSQCSALYGCPLWNLEDTNVENLCTAWKVCCRKIIGLKPDARSNILHHLMNSLPIRDIIMLRMLNFIKSGIHHNNIIITNFFKNILLSNSSYTIKNVNMILSHLNISYKSIFTENNKVKLKAEFHSNMPKPDWRTNSLRELLDINENILSCDLNHEEVKALIDHISRSRLYP